MKPPTLGNITKIHFSTLETVSKWFASQEKVKTLQLQFIPTTFSPCVRIKYRSNKISFFGSHYKIHHNHDYHYTDKHNAEG